MIKKNSITLKLFLVTTIFFIFFTTVTMILQSAFFEQFYVNYKMKRLQNNVNQFEETFLENRKDRKVLLKSIMKFQEDNNAVMVIADDAGNLTYIKNINNKTPESTTMMALAEAMDQWMNNPAAYANSKKTGETCTNIIKNEDFNVSNIISIDPIMLGNDVVYTIFAASSLQPIGEAAIVIREMYFYFYIFALFIIILLSLIYSNMITKPLINLNKTVARIAKLDFSARCNVNSNDEIGSLSRNFNLLCEKLDNALEELRNANAKLKEDIEKERGLEKMRKEFVAGVSHELKTPISLIEGYAEGLKDGIVEGEKKEYYLDVIIEEANKMAKLVSDMLDISQLESGNFKLNLGTFHISQLISEVINKHIQLLNDKKINLKVKVENSTAVIGDRFRIEQVITNFITNAIRYTIKEKDIDLFVEEKEKYVVITIENEGNNIEEGQIDKLWDKFYRIDKSRNRDEGGTGLGLAICKNILLLHHSNFGVKNTERGVLFYFTLEKEQ